MPSLPVILSSMTTPSGSILPPPRLVLRPTTCRGWSQALKGGMGGHESIQGLYPEIDVSKGPLRRALHRKLFIDAFLLPLCGNFSSSMSSTKIVGHRGYKYLLWNQQVPPLPLDVLISRSRGAGGKEHYSLSLHTGGGGKPVR